MATSRRCSSNGTDSSYSTASAGCGVACGAAGAAKVATEIAEGVIVFIVSDAGWKYLSTGAYTDDLDSAEKQAERTIYF